MKRDCHRHHNQQQNQEYTCVFIKRKNKMAAEIRKISRGTDGNDMLNLKKAALGITSKFGLLNTHRSLVVAVSEEKQVHEALLKLVLSRVNAGTSLLRWAKTEENTDLRDCINRLYDVNLMWATVQKDYIEQNSALVTSLKDILQIEAGLDALQKHSKQVSEKREKLQQRKLNGGNRRLEKTESVSDEILKLQDEEESLKSELEVKSVKAEIFKTTTLKSSLTKIADAHLQLSKKMDLIFTTTKKIVQSLDDVPCHLKVGTTSEGNEEQTIEEIDEVAELAKFLNIQRSASSSSLPRSGGGNVETSVASVFHVELPKTSSLSKNRNAINNQIKNNNNQQILTQKKISGAKFTSGIKKIFGKGGNGATSASQVPKDESAQHSDFDTDFVMVSNNSPPKVLPPLPGYQPALRRRSRSTIDPPTFIKSHQQRKEVNNNRSSKVPVPVEENSSDEDDDDYITPNPNLHRRYSLRKSRSKSESKLDTVESESDYGYSRPWDLIQRPNTNPQYDEPEGIDSVPKYEYSRAYEHFSQCNTDDRFSTYQDPKDCIAEALYSDFSTLTGKYMGSDEDLYDTPYDIKEQVEELYRSQSVPHPLLPVITDIDINDDAIYQNSLKLLDEIQYVDKEELQRIQSRPDSSSGKIVVEQKSPLPLPRHATLDKGTKTNNRSSSLSGSEIARPLPLKPDQKRKHSPILPLKPKPKPRPKSTYDQIDKISFDAGAPNVRDLAQQLKTRIRPSATVPNITQAKIAASERVNYENNFTKY